MSASGISQIGETGEIVKVHTYYYVREDNISLYGFNTQEELKMFELLLGVSGVGARTALAMLATCTPSEFALAVVSEDVKVLTEIPGIGPKSAKRIILELKDKIKKEQVVEGIKEEISKNEKRNNRTLEIAEVKEKVSEAIQALQVLGYNKKEIEKVFEKLDVKELTTEELIKKGLNLLNR